MSKHAVANAGSSSRGVSNITRPARLRWAFDGIKRMHWIYLTLAILSEVAGTTCMKLSEGFSRLVPAALMAVFYIVCFGFLTLALKKVDVSVAYAIWSGLGTALIATIGVLWFREPINLLKVCGLVAIIGGIVALNLSGGTH